MAKKISDAELLEALLLNGSVRDAAAALNITQSAIYQRLQAPELRRQYDSLQGVIVSSAAASMTAALDSAVAALIEIIRNTKINPSIRVQASGQLLHHANRYIETASVLRRLDELEEQIVKCKS